MQNVDNIYNIIFFTYYLKFMAQQIISIKKVTDKNN